MRNMAEIYRQRIAALYDGRQNEDGKASAVRGLLQVG
jgi:hypothetical protein